MFILLLSIYPPYSGNTQTVTIEDISMDKRVNFIIDSFMRKQDQIDSIADFTLSTAKEIYMDK